MNTQTAPQIPHQVLVQRAKLYLDRVPGAVQGEAGDKHTLSAACRIARGFALPKDISLKLLFDWNRKCRPAWSEKEIRQKVENALKYGTEPIGHLINSDPPKGKPKGNGHSQSAEYLSASPKFPIEPKRHIAQIGIIDSQLPAEWRGKPISCGYDYHDANENVVYQVARVEYKDERGDQKKEFPVWCKGSWGLKDKGVEKVPFRLTKLLQAIEGSEIWICEGEKDVLSLEKLGFTATTNPGGAGKWLPEFNKYLKPSFRIITPPDNDTAGRDHSKKVASSLHGSVASIKILPLPNLPEHGDVSDFVKEKDPIAAAEDLCRLAEAAPEWKPEEPEAKPSIIHWAKEALEPQPEKEWIVKDLIGSSDVLTLIGDAGSKKTYSSLDLAVCAALGKEWLGRRVSPSCVLIVDEESGERRLKMRLGDCMRAHNADANLPIAFTTMAGITLNSDTGADCLSQVITETKARFIVMDSLQDFSLGADENSGKELAPVIHRLKVIAEKQDCAIWLIHHLNKQGGYRGHSSIKGLIDVMLKCESDTSSNLIQFTAEKCRDSLIDPFAATAHFDIGRFWLSDAEPKAKAIKLSKPKSYVIDYMMKQPDRTAKMTDIMANADRCAPESARRAVYDFVEEGKMKLMDGGGGRGNPAIYQWVGI